MRRGTRGAGAYRRGDGAVAGEMGVLSRFWGPKRDKIVPPDTKSARSDVLSDIDPPGGDVERDEHMTRGVLR